LGAAQQALKDMGRIRRRGAPGGLGYALAYPWRSRRSFHCVDTPYFPINLPAEKEAFDQASGRDIFPSPESLNLEVKIPNWLVGPYRCWPGYPGRHRSFPDPAQQGAVYPGQDTTLQIGTCLLVVGARRAWKTPPLVGAKARSFKKIPGPLTVRHILGRRKK